MKIGSTSCRLRAVYIALCKCVVKINLALLSKRFASFMKNEVAIKGSFKWQFFIQPTKSSRIKLFHEKRSQNLRTTQLYSFFLLFELSSFVWKEFSKNFPSDDFDIYLRISQALFHDLKPFLWISLFKRNYENCFWINLIPWKKTSMNNKMLSFLINEWKSFKRISVQLKNIFIINFLWQGLFMSNFFILCLRRPFLNSPSASHFHDRIFWLTFKLF